MDERADPSPPAPGEGGEAFLQGTIERVTYRHPETGYTVLRLVPERGFADPEALFEAPAGRSTAVGPAPGAGEGMRVRLRGSWKHHPRHGRQFAFETLSLLPPLDREGLVRYLASPTFRGVGPKLAERIVDALGQGALARIRTEPEALEGIPGLPQGVREELVRTVQAELGAQEARAFLYGTGLGPALADAALRRLGVDAEALVRADPWRLSREVPGIGFARADTVAQRLEVAADAPERRRAALLHVLREAGGEGHVLLPLEELVRRAASLIECDADLAPWQADLEALAREEELILDARVRPGATLAYPPAYHVAEERLARNLLALGAAGPLRPLADRERLTAAEARTGLALSEEQREAVLGLLRAPLSLLTGGPGVGKTTIVRLVCELAEGAGVRIVLASPTGRAAKRLAEATGREASTIHRLLGWEPATGRFQHDARRPLEADLVVVDEVSMVDLVLAHHLVKAIQPPTRLALVGDPDQLPSVSPGNVLADLLASERVPVSRLTEVHRQEAGGRIVVNAHRILAGEMPLLPARDEGPSDFYFFAAEDDRRAAELLIDVVTRRIPQRFGLDWIHDVQVLSPMYRGACGVDALNEGLREALGLGGREVRWRDRVWRVGDRVIHTRNDYERMVFNGDMGRIVRIGEDGPEIVVRFPERELVYAKGEFGDLRPAFAITVHRAQGGEFPAVVVPVVTQHWAMLQRNLLYTAVTRARRLVVLVGSRRALARAIENADVSARESALVERLRLDPDDGG